MFNKKKYALEVQTELKTIASQMLQDWGRANVDLLGWDVEHTDDNYVDSEIWFGNDYIYSSEEKEPGVWVEYTRSIICVTELREKEHGLYEVTVKVHLPGDDGVHEKYFKGEYLFNEINPLDTANGYPDALYEAYIYFAENTEFSYSEKLSYLTGAMWEFVSCFEDFCRLDCNEILGKFAKADVEATY
ncbi:hypothetical protein [Vibrio parahaemolyticus]|uniref:hypothetical protein n=1 Tax=Vibrio parahaemolyticus TaxID=670 RepID=UPI000470AD0D|nr:hypothetical protein [Vibrio parahaemolyticus]